MKEMTREVLEEMLTDTEICMDYNTITSDMLSIDCVDHTTSIDPAKWYIYNDRTTQYPSVIYDNMYRNDPAYGPIATQLTTTPSREKSLEHELKRTEEELEKLKLLNESLIAMLLALRHNSWSI
jgi:hypothetical protein